MLRDATYALYVVYICLLSGDRNWINTGNLIYIEVIRVGVNPDLKLLADSYI